MNPAPAQTLRDLLRTQEVAALGTLHKGPPYVSMVLFAMRPGSTDFIIHVSQLAAHPQVNMLMFALPTPEVMAQELARITVQCAAPGEPNQFNITLCLPLEAAAGLKAIYVLLKLSLFHTASTLCGLLQLGIPTPARAVKGVKDKSMPQASPILSGPIGLLEGPVP